MTKCRYISLLLFIFNQGKTKVKTALVLTMKNITVPAEIAVIIPLGKKCHIKQTTALVRTFGLFVKYILRYVCSTHLVSALSRYSSIKVILTYHF